MNRIFLLDQHTARDDSRLIGGKGAALSRLIKAGCTVPRTTCITTEFYTDFLNHHGLRERIALELNRKELSDMRWEEVWDTALRIRRLFTTTPIPGDMASELTGFLEQEFGDTLLAIRSSSPDEDQQHTSFAGLHSSYLHIPVSAVLSYLRLVWASLWSDKALLYRRELALSPETSSMAVVVQEMVDSRISGISFTRDPMGSENMVVEAVYGYNQGLVDGALEPDRWFIARSSGIVISHNAPTGCRYRCIGVKASVSVEPVQDEKAEVPPLTEKLLKRVFQECMHLESLFSLPLDIEWSFAKNALYILQARPISTLSDQDSEDKRGWYVSLHRNFDNLITLRDAIVHDMLPKIEQEVCAMQEVDLESLDDHRLARHILHCSQRSRHWTDIYWRDCIPFAHGIRLFGEIYNDLMAPDDPYEFVLLLTDQELLSTDRNRMIDELAGLVRQNPVIRQQLEAEGTKGVSDPHFCNALDLLTSRFPLFPGTPEANETSMLAGLILEYASRPRRSAPENTAIKNQLEQLFLTTMSTTESPVGGSELLDLARSSYKLRDDDNIYLGRIEQEVERAVSEGTKRIPSTSRCQQAACTPEETAALLMGESTIQSSAPQPADQSHPKREKVLARQLVGQPASKGIATGPAKVIRQPEELASFKAGEILVVRAIDPNMTFIAPLASAIVEERGGMLIHGAIIAREYAIPCVTGINGAVDRIKSGDRITVDGHFGIITIDRQTAAKR